jgi:hypothetical protein
LFPGQFQLFFPFVLVFVLSFSQSLYHLANGGKPVSLPNLGGQKPDNNPFLRPKEGGKMAVAAPGLTKTLPNHLLFNKFVQNVKPVVLKLKI